VSKIEHRRRDDCDRLSLDVETSGRLSRVRLERRNFAVQLPKLDIMAIHQLSRLFDCLVVGGAF